MHLEPFDNNLYLIIVPTLYSLVYTTSCAAERVVKRIRRAYWAPFYRLTGTASEEEDFPGSTGASEK